MEGFRYVGEVTADQRRRIPLGKAGVAPDSRYMISTNEQGDILLTPMVSMSRSTLRRLAVQFGVTETDLETSRE